MSSITGSCESPANLLFRQGLEKSEEIHATKVQDDKQTNALYIEKLSTEINANSSTRTGADASSSNQGGNQQEGYKGIIINTYV